MIRLLLTISLKIKAPLNKRWKGVGDIIYRRYNFKWRGSFRSFPASLLVVDQNQQFLSYTLIRCSCLLAAACRDGCYSCCYYTRQECWAQASPAGHPVNVVCRRWPWQETLASCRVPWIGEIASRHRCPRPSASQPVFPCHPLTTFPKSAVCSHYRLLPPNEIKAR